MSRVKDKATSYTLALDSSVLTTVHFNQSRLLRKTNRGLGSFEGPACQKLDAVVTEAFLFALGHVSDHCPAGRSNRDPAVTSWQRQADFQLLVLHGVHGAMCTNKVPGPLKVKQLHIITEPPSHPTSGSSLYNNPFYSNPS